MKPRDKTAAEVAAVVRLPGNPVLAMRPDWNEKNDEAFGALRGVKAAMLGQSLVNYATAPIGAKKYDAGTLSRS